MNNFTNTATSNTNELKPMSNFEDWIYQNMSDPTMPYSEKMNVSQSDSTLPGRGYTMDGNNKGHHNLGHQDSTISYSSNDNVNQFANINNMDTLTNFSNNTNQYPHGVGLAHPNGMNKSLSLDGANKNYTFNSIDDTRNLSTISNTNAMNPNTIENGTHNNPFNVYDLDFHTVQKKMQARNASLLAGNDGLYKIEENSCVESNGSGDTFANYQAYNRLTSDGMIGEHDMRYDFLNTPASTIMSATTSNASTHNAFTFENNNITANPESSSKKNKKAKNKGKKNRNNDVLVDSCEDIKEQNTKGKKARSGRVNGGEQENELTTTSDAAANISTTNDKKRKNIQNDMVKLETTGLDQSSVLQMPHGHEMMEIKLEHDGTDHLDLMLEDMPAEVLGIDVGMGVNDTGAATKDNYLKTEQDNNDTDAISKEKPASRKRKNKKKIMTAQQKEIHNKVEKKYRININTKIARLQKVIPWLASGNASTAFEIHESEQLGKSANGDEITASSSSSSSAGSSISAESSETLVPEESETRSDSMIMKSNPLQKNDTDERKDSVVSQDSQPKLNKSIILEKAVDYIMYLQNNEKLYGLEVQKLKAEIKRLKKKGPKINIANPNNNTMVESSSNLSNCSSHSTQKDLTARSSTNTEGPSSGCVSPTNTCVDQTAETFHEG